MSDEKDKIAATETVSEPPVEDADTGPGLGVENPLMAYVKDGTTTWASEQEVQRQWLESEHRRNVAARERELSNVPIDSGGAVMHTHKLTENPEIPKAYIELTYLNRHGTETGEKCMADIIVGVGNNPTELMLILVCPNCVHNRGRHHDQAQIQIRQSNKMFHFVAGMGNPTFVFDDMPYNSAGMIMESEKFTCPNCSWSARIDHNRVIPE